jgi:hypothetical protein
MPTRRSLAESRISLQQRASLKHARVHTPERSAHEIINLSNSDNGEPGHAGRDAVGTSAALSKHARMHAPEVIVLSDSDGEELLSAGEHDREAVQSDDEELAHAGEHNGELVRSDDALLAELHASICKLESVSICTF